MTLPGARGAGFALTEGAPGGSSMLGAGASALGARPVEWVTVARPLEGGEPELSSAALALSASGVVSSRESPWPRPSAAAER